MGGLGMVMFGPLAAGPDRSRWRRARRGRHSALFVPRGERCRTVSPCRLGPGCRSRAGSVRGLFVRGVRECQPDRDLAEHRSTIGLRVEPYDRQEHRLLECAKDVRHSDYIVAIRSPPSSGPGTVHPWNRGRRPAGLAWTLRSSTRIPCDDGQLARRHRRSFNSEGRERLGKIEYRASGTVIFGARCAWTWFSSAQCTSAQLGDACRCETDPRAGRSDLTSPLLTLPFVTCQLVIGESVAPQKGLGELERRVLEFLWANGPATGETVRIAVSKDRLLADSTIRTVLRRLEAKQYVRHQTDGRQFLYSSARDPRRVATEAISAVLKNFCRGSVEELLAGLVDHRVVNAAELRRLAARIGKRTNRKGKP
jgi:BlaI family penicillinase repressor